MASTQPDTFVPNAHTKKCCFSEVLPWPTAALWLWEKLPSGSIRTWTDFRSSARGIDLAWRKRHIFALFCFKLFPALPANRMTTGNAFDPCRKNTQDTVQPRVLSQRHLCRICFTLDFPFFKNAFVNCFSANDFSAIYCTKKRCGYLLILGIW